MVPPNIFGCGNFFILESLLGLFKGYMQGKLYALVWRSINLVLKLNSKIFMNLDL